MGKLSDTIGNFSDGGSTPKEYAKEVKIVAGTSNVLRFIDGGNSFLEYYISWIPYEDDTTGKIGPFIVKNEKEGSSLLGEMFGEGQYFQNGYLESKKGQFGKTFTHQAKDPELFKAMTEYWNPAYQGIGTCKPKKEFIFNVIQRNPETIDGVQTNWCAKEKHTKILRLGQKAMAPLGEVEKNDGDLNEYDINYTKQGTGIATIHSTMKAGVNVTYVVPGLLTAEEANYARYPLDEIIKLSSAFSCMKHIPTKIKRMDAVMGTNFFARFEKQAAMENELWEKAKAQNPANAVIQNPFDDSNVPLDPAPAAPVAPPTVAGPIPSRRVKAAADPSVVTGPMIECSACKKQIPQGSVICPECKTTLLEPCPECNNLFSITEKECPVCHTTFE